MRRILVVEDEVLLRDLIVDACTRHGFDTRGAATAMEARNAVSEFDPDLVVLDIDLGDGPSGADLGHLLERQHPDIALLYLTRFADLRAAGYGSTPGTSVGYLHKEAITSTDELMMQVNAMFRPEVSARRDDLAPGHPLDVLTDAQLDVLRLTSLGLSNRAIAAQRNTSESAVEAHLTAIFRILSVARSPEVNQRVAAIRWYVEAVGRPLELFPSALPPG